MQDYWCGECPKCGGDLYCYEDGSSVVCPNCGDN